MISRWFLVFFLCVFGPLFLWVLTSAAMSRDCSPLEEKPIKVEAWMSKQYEKNLRQIRKEFSAMGGYARYPMGLPGKKSIKDSGYR